MLSIRVTVFHWNAGHERDQDFYLDISDVTVEGDIWRTVDHYLDLVVRTGRGTELVDVDELLEAHKAGLIDDHTAEKAINAAVRAVSGLSGHNHDLHSWLMSNGIDLSWR